MRRLCGQSLGEPGGVSPRALTSTHLQRERGRARVAFLFASLACAAGYLIKVSGTALAAGKRSCVSKQRTGG